MWYHKCIEHWYQALIQVDKMVKMPIANEKNLLPAIETKADCPVGVTSNRLISLKLRQLHGFVMMMVVWVVILMTEAHLPVFEAFGVSWSAPKPCLMRDKHGLPCECVFISVCLRTSFVWINLIRVNWSDSSTKAWSGKFSVWTIALTACFVLAGLPIHSPPPSLSPFLLFCLFLYGFWFFFLCARFLTEREQRLVRRRLQAEELLQWRQRLDAEEAMVRRMEKQALAAWEQQPQRKHPAASATPLSNNSTTFRQDRSPERGERVNSTCFSVLHI